MSRSPRRVLCRSSSARAGCWQYCLRAASFALDWSEHYSCIIQLLSDDLHTDGSCTRPGSVVRSLTSSGICCFKTLYAPLLACLLSPDADGQHSSKLSVSRKIRLSETLMVSSGVYEQATKASRHRSVSLASSRTAKLTSSHLRVLCVSAMTGGRSCCRMDASLKRTLSCLRQDLSRPGKISWPVSNP